MKLSCQENLVKGSGLKEKVEKLESFGFEGVELWGNNLKERLDEVKLAFRGREIKVSTICSGYGGCLLDPNKEERDKAIRDIKELLSLCAELGAVGLVVVPIFGPPKLPDLTPIMNVLELEKRLLIELLNELGEYAHSQGTYILLEPLNRYETHFVRTLNDAKEILTATHGKGLKMMADFFHMNIEEADIPQSLSNNIEFISHIHLADSNRLLPGMGHTDFASSFKILKEKSYSGYMALECGIPGDPDELLPKTVKYLKSLI
ncbi:sugar phosphate isomerase/epimerase [bacterium]|nr:sugar phosphate isomerase/epimerase [bacterium]